MSKYEKYKLDSIKHYLVNLEIKYKYLNELIEIDKYSLRKAGDLAETLEIMNDDIQHIWAELFILKR